MNIVAQIKSYVERYRNCSANLTECDNYRRSIDSYLAMIAHNNQIIAAKYGKKK